MLQFTAPAFAPDLEQTFRFCLSSLIPVADGPGGRLNPGRRQSFSLLFELRGQAPLRRGFERLQHPDIDACDLFLARVHVPEKNPGAVYHKVVFG